MLVYEFFVFFVFAILFFPDQGLLSLIVLVGLLGIGAKTNYISPTACVHWLDLPDTVIICLLPLLLPHMIFIFLCCFRFPTFKIERDK